MTPENDGLLLEQAKVVAPLFREAVRKAAEYGWDEEFFMCAAALVYAGYRTGREAGIAAASTPVTTGGAR